MWNRRYRKSVLAWFLFFSLHLDKIYQSLLHLILCFAFSKNSLMQYFLTLFLSPLKDSPFFGRHLQHSVLHSKQHPVLLSNQHPVLHSKQHPVLHFKQHAVLNKKIFQLSVHQLVMPSNNSNDSVLKHHISFGNLKWSCSKKPLINASYGGREIDTSTRRKQIVAGYRKHNNFWSCAIFVRSQPWMQDWLPASSKWRMTPMYPSTWDGARSATCCWRKGWLGPATKHPVLLLVPKAPADDSIQQLYLKWNGYDCCWNVGNDWFEVSQ